MPPKAAGDRQLSAATKLLIRTAHAAGVASVAMKESEGRTITLAGNKKLTLMKSDGQLTANGKYYYTELLDLKPPTLYAYEASIKNEKWVQGFSGKRILIRKWRNGEWVPTVAGLPYFKYLRDEHTIKVSTLKIIRGDTADPVVLRNNRTNRDNEEWVQENIPHTLSDQRFTTPYLKSPAAGIAYRELTTEAQRKSFVLELSLIHISEPTRLRQARMPSSSCKKTYNTDCCRYETWTPR